MNESDCPTIIGPDASFKGELTFEKSVKVLGNFEGRIITNGSLEVAVGGKIQADIEAGNINVEGDIHGLGVPLHPTQSQVQRTSRVRCTWSRS